MALRINTNVAALSAHKNMIKNDNALSASLEKLSSGLRINKAADDASGMAIADSLKSQALGLGQAIRNANDGISMVQTADGALEESINIVNTIKTKAIQAAQDGQTTESRKAIQSDITKLLEELDTIAQTTAFNNQKLLSGNFTDKKFQVGAYSGETVNISIASSESTKVGHVTSGNLSLTNASGGTVQLSIYSNLQSKEFTLQAVDIKANNSAENGMGALADAINKLSDVLGISASAVVESKSSAAVAAGSTGSDFAINGVSIGAVTTVANDSDGALVKAINNKTSDHGISASVGADGILKLTSSDGRAISVTGGTGAVLAGSQMSTFGHVQLKQAGSNELLVTDLAGGSATDFTTNVTTGSAMSTTIDSTLAAGSTIATASTLAAGTTIGGNLVGDTNFAANIVGTFDSTIKAGSTIGGTSTIESGSVLGGKFTTSAATYTTTGAALLTAGTTLAGGSTLAAGTVITQDLIDANGDTIAAGTTLNADTTLALSAVTLSSDMIVAHGTVLNNTSTLNTGSYFGVDLVTAGNTTLTQDMTVKAGSTIEATGSTLLAGSEIGGTVTLTGALTTTQSMAVESGSTIATASTLAAGSTLGGSVVADGALTAQNAVSLSAGSILLDGTTLAQGTILTNDMNFVEGAGTVSLSAGTVLERDYVTSGNQTLAQDMTIAKDSVIQSGSTLAANAGGSSGTKMADTTTNRLADVSVLTQEGAQIAIAVADSALKDLDKVRSDLGSVQNQLTSTISNISVTKVNISAAESSIRDVDFAEESANFSRMQILTQASTFAMAQANASAQNVLSLLQG
ncbi:MAG: flagellar protein FlaB [Desulfobulbaceae bacterium DB1]|nr:MAG: flagellar protein FlaB [Desulfobulbaceae bacterium DB1]